MREILFRGKRIDDGEWVLGYYFWSEKEKKHYMIGESVDYGFQKIEVMPEKVGQYIGLKDMNNGKIFEGDLICNDDNNCGVGAIEWDEINAAYLWIMDDGNNEEMAYFEDNGVCQHCEICGNIHDSEVKSNEN